jgi:hypothetical protein
MFTVLLTVITVMLKARTRSRSLSHLLQLRTRVLSTAIVQEMVQQSFPIWGSLTCITLCKYMACGNVTNFWSLSSHALLPIYHALWLWGIRMLKLLVLHDPFSKCIKNILY